MIFPKPIKVMAFLLFLGLSVVYIHNLSRSVYGGDVGDFVTAAFVGGVPHPPGYPLFTLLGFLLSKIDFGQTIAFNVGLISALSSALGVSFYFLLIYYITKNTLISLISSLILAFTYIYWFYAEIAEVFALNNLFTILLFLAAILFRKTAKRKYFYLLCFLAGLSATNHHTTVLIFPSLLLLTAEQFWKLFVKDKKIVLFGILSGFSAALIYLYVPVASSMHPVVNWDNVHDFQSFKHLILREGYGTFSAGAFVPPSFEHRVVILKTYLWYLVYQITIPVIFFSILGLGYLIKKERLLGVAFLLAFFISGPLFVGYAGFPLLNGFYIGIYERFFAMSAVVILFLFPFGLVLFSLFLKKFLRKDSIHLVLLGFLFIPCMLFYYNFEKTNLSSIYIGDTLGKDFLITLPKNTILFLSGDTQLFNTLYMRYVKQIRTDVTVLNVNGLESSEFFTKQRNEIIKSHPKEKDPKTITVNTVIKLADTYPVYTESKISLGKNSKWEWIPYGLVSKLHKKTEKIDKGTYKNQVETVLKTIHIPKRDPSNRALGSLSISVIPAIYSNALLEIGNYFYSRYDDPEQAFLYYKKAYETDNQNGGVYTTLALYYLVKKSCDSAKNEIQQALHYDKFQKINHVLLYSIYNDCYRDRKKAEQVVKEYKTIFKEDFYKNVKEMLNI